MDELFFVIIAMAFIALMLTVSASAFEELASTVDVQEEISVIEFDTVDEIL